MYSMINRSALFFLMIMLAGLRLAAGGKGEDKSYPSQDIIFIAPYAEGGGTDFTARALAVNAEKHLGVNISVENRVGASGAIGMIEGASSVPDGYTVTVVTRELVSLPLMGLAQITSADFELICLINEEPAMLAVRPDSPYRNLDYLIEQARAQPGRIRFASAAKPHFYILEMEDSLGISFNKIPFNGAARAIPAVIQGVSDFTLANPGELKDSIRQGLLVPVAVLSGRRMGSFPDVPTFAELGYPITAVTWRGMAVPKNTPEAVRNQLEEAFSRAVREYEFVRVMNESYYTPYYLGRDDFAAYIERDTEEIAELVKKLH